MIDLHCHSTFSDGLHSPEDLLSLAINNGVRCLALTDHDTLDGLSDLHKAASAVADHPITIINGIELSVNWKKHLIHILGLNLRDPDKLSDLIQAQKSLRFERAQQIALKLESLDVDQAFDKVLEIVGHEGIGRPHFAQLLLNEGRVKDIQQAFKKYLGRGKPAYVPTKWIAMEEAIAGIHEAGGAAVIAHPLHYGLTKTALSEFIQAFKAGGGDGMEVVSGWMSGTQREELAAFCQRYDLLASSGSDFHGQGISRVDVGKQLPLPDHCTPIWQTWTI